MGTRFKPYDIALAELRRNPSADSRTIARKIFNQNPGVWTSIEAARSAVRGCRGASGESNRLKVKTQVPRIEVPPADDIGWKVHELPIGIKRWLDISDVHIPYHSPKAFRLALEFGRSEGCDGVLINGDFIDFCRISRFQNDPRLRDPAGEIELAKRGLDSVEQVGAKEVVFKEGNHDSRLAKFMMQRCPELFAVLSKHCNLDMLLGLTQRGIKYIPDTHPIQHRELTILHGHEWGKGISNPVNPARGAFLKAIDNVLIGHLHQTSDHTQPTIRGVVVSSWSTGCLCNLRPHYQPVGNKWNHGFAVITTGANWSIKNYRIINERKIT